MVKIFEVQSDSRTAHSHASSAVRLINPIQIPLQFQFQLQLFTYGETCFENIMLSAFV